MGDWEKMTLEAQTYTPPPCTTTQVSRPTTHQLTKGGTEKVEGAGRVEGVSDSGGVGGVGRGSGRSGERGAGPNTAPASSDPSNTSTKRIRPGAHKANY